MSAKRVLLGLGAFLMGASLSALLAMRFINSTTLTLPAPTASASPLAPARPSSRASRATKSKITPQKTPRQKPPPRATPLHAAPVRAIPVHAIPVRSMPVRAMPAQAAHKREKIRQSAQTGIVSVHYPSSVEVVRLKYADVSEVAGILSNKAVAPQDTFAASPSIFALPAAIAGGIAYGAPTSPVSAQPTAPPSAAERITENLAIDRRLNAAVLSGDPEVVAYLRAMIHRLDVSAPSVRLDCEVVELTRSGAEHVGVDYASSGAFASAQLLGLSGGAPVTEVSLLARVLAEIQSGNGQLLATPRVVAINGKPVSILDGEAVPVVSSQIIGRNPVVVQENVAYVDVGVHLSVQPRVSADGKITSHIFAEFSNVTAETGAALGKVPQVTLRQTSTTATAAEGQPFVIGGFFRIVERDELTRTPVLGYLPLIGNLFRVRHRTSQDTNLYIIITPHIVK